MDRRMDAWWMDGWMKKMRSSHTVEYYVALKRKEILTPATTRVNLRPWRSVREASHRRTNAIRVHVHEDAGGVRAKP